MFQKAGIPTVTTPDIENLLWGKVIYNAALNPLASWLGCHYGLLGEHGLTRQAMEKVVAEIYEVARKAKVHLTPATADKYRKLFYSTLLPRTYDHRPSMLADLEQGRRTEIDAMNGAIVRLGKKFKVKTPVNRLLMKLIKEKEKR